MHVLAAQESREMESVGDAQTRHATDHVVHHVARTRHDEAHVRHSLEHLGGRLDEVVGTLLVGYAAEERHDLVLHAALGHLVILLGETHRVVHRHHLVGGDAVLLYDDVAREVRHRYDPVGRGHSRAFDGIRLTVDVLARTVVLRGVHMHHQRLARHAFGGYAREIGQPVVGMYHVELSLEILGHLSGHHGITRNLLQQVRAVLSRERISLGPAIALALPQFAARALVLFAIGGELLGRDVGNHVRVDVDERNFLHYVVGSRDGRIAIGGLDIAGIHHLHEALVLVSRGARHHEDHLHVVTRQSSRHAVTRRAQTSGNMGRELPAKH